MSELSAHKKIGLALSGGGVRAVAFHAGVLRWLAERGQLENVVHISSVSGGSLFTGLVFHTANYSWPSSEDYLQKTLPQLSKMLTTKSLQTNAIVALIFNPLNWRYLLSRANVLARTIERVWGICGVLKDLPTHPIWSINGSTFENGRRFRFKNGRAGDYESGYADVRNFKLAKAMAVSAAFPGGIGPLAFNAEEFEWYKKDGWDSLNPEQKIRQPFKKLHIYDGGVYDNLGMEPLFDVGERKIKKSAGDINYIIVSDAGTPLMLEKPLCALELLRLKRVYDITFNQSRALRVRCFVKYLLEKSSSGMYLEIGSDPFAKLKQFAPAYADTDSWLPYQQVTKCASISTSLGKLSIESFERLVQHGYETAKWNNLAFEELQ